MFTAISNEIYIEWCITIITQQTIHIIIHFHQCQNVDIRCTKLSINNDSHWPKRPQHLQINDDNASNIHHTNSPIPNISILLGRKTLEHVWRLPPRPLHPPRTIPGLQPLCNPGLAQNQQALCVVRPLHSHLRTPLSVVEHLHWV